MYEPRPTFSLPDGDQSIKILEQLLGRITDFIQRETKLNEASGTVNSDAEGNYDPVMMMGRTGVGLHTVQPLTASVAPGDVYISLAWSYPRERMNLSGMIAEIKKSSERCRTQNAKSKVTLVATPPHLVREGMLRSFPSTPTKLRAVDDVVLRGGCRG